MADPTEPTTPTMPSSEALFESATAPDQSSPPAPEPAATPPSAPVQPPAAAEAPPPTSPPEAPIPSWRLREEAEGRRLAEDRARMLEARLAEVAAHIQQNTKQPDFFENPDQATQALIARVLQPYAEETRRSMMHMGKMVASALHGADKVDAAERAFLEARSAETLDPADYERVVQAPNRYDAVVAWHKRQSVLANVGEDPNAWWEKQLEARLADPQFQGKMLERLRGAATGRPSETRIPPTLSRTTAAAANGSDQLGDMSNSSLFEYATRARPR